MRICLLPFLFLFLTSCALLGKPGEYRSFFSQEISLEPILHFSNQVDPSDGREFTVPIYFKPTGEIVEGLLFDQYEWGYSFRVRTRKKTVVRPRGTRDAPARSDYVEVEKVIEKKPVAKGSCFTTFFIPTSAPVSQKYLSELFSPNHIRVSSTAENQLREATEGMTYTLDICFNEVPIMTIDIISVELTPNR